MSVLAAVLAAVGAVLLLPGRVDLRTGVRAGGRVASTSSPLRRARPLLCVMAAVGGWAVLGGVVGVAAGLAAAAAVWVVLGRSEDPALERRRVRLAQDLPAGVDLLGTCLEAGAAPESALATVAAALGGPVGDELAAIGHRLAVGMPPGEVWRAVAAHPQLGPLGRAVGRAHETGASIGPAVHRLAEELRERADAEVEARARSIEVKAAAPLGLCLLPAFMLLGVVPLVAGLFTSMHLFR